MRGRRSLAAALIVVSFNLRLPVASVPPILTQIRHSTGLSSAGGGLLTTVPVLCFGLAALAAPRLIRRFSMGRLLVLTMAAVIGGCVLRLAPSLPALFAGTAVIGCGLAVSNVLVPGLIRRDFHDRRVIMTTLYSVALGGSAACAAGLTIPVERALGVGWHAALALWGIAAAVAVLLWLPHARREAARGAASEGAPVVGLMRDPLAWCVTAFMGLQSFGFYATLSWLPTILRAHGMPAAEAGLMLSLAAFSGMGSALVVPTIERRSRWSGSMVSLCVGFCACGYAGLLLSPSALQPVWCVLMGLGQGAMLALALGYIVARSPDSNHAAHLSTMAQSGGYMLAATGPFVMGALHDLSGGWAVPLVMLIVTLVPMLAVGLRSAQDRLVLAPVLAGG